MKKIEKIMPRYTWLPFLVSAILLCITFYGTRLVTHNMYHYDVTMKIDDLIPFWSPMILIYIGAYISWAVGYIVIGRESKELCYELLAAEQIAKIICFFIFLFFPTTMVRADITGNGICDNLTKLIYFLDTPDNLFPSMHCLSSWFCFRGALRCKKVGTTYKILTFVMAILVFASTLMVKQHVFIDVISGVLVMEISFFLSKKMGGSRVYYALEQRRKNETKE